jgi:YHS domain-containing protein
MPKAEAAAAATAASAAAAAKQVSSAASATVDAAKKQADFLDPFGAAESDESADPLDLDSIAEAMQEQESSLKQQAGAAAAAAVETVQEKAAEADAAVQEAEQALKSVAEDNPFTGVILEQQQGAVPEAIQFEEAEAAQEARRVQTPVSEPAQTAELPALPAADDPAAAPSEQLRSLPDEKLRVAMENDERQKQLSRIRERGDQAGFKGFCPVALRDHRELVDADPAITAQFGLQTWAFSSEQARSLFEADPTRYAPASGGCDVVVLAREGVERPGRLDFALWFRGRLYMFESRDSMSEFHAAPRSFAVEQ